jgi:glucose/arabinose dehydrogenase
MRISTCLGLAAALWAASIVLPGCGDDGKTTQPEDPEDGLDGGDPGGQLGRDASADTRRDATLDAQPATSADARAADASEQGADAATREPDAALGINASSDAQIITLADAQADASETDAATPDASLPPDPPACDPSAAPVVGRLGLQTIISSGELNYLTEATQPPDSNDWYLVQQNGIIRVLRDGALLPEPFLDLSAEVTLLNDLIYEDRGLVSIEFAPDYATSGRFFVSITPNLGWDTNVDQVRAYRRQPSEPPRADLTTRENILEVRGRWLSPLSPITANIHNGGRVAFGPDGMLYVAMGDGGGIQCGDSEPNATQDPSTLFGKLLRLDLSKPPFYGATDNPFVVGGDARVLHYGLRNPFRFSFDRQTGDLYLGDVGQNDYEELDYAPAGSRGLNFGWAAYEGDSEIDCGVPRALRTGSTHTRPIFVADRSADASNPFSDYNAIIGGVVYRGSALPQLNGIYFFGGYIGARLGALRQCGSTTSPITPVTKRCNANTPNEACFRTLDGGPALNELRAIVEDHDGEMYMVANRNTFYKVVANTP